MIESVTELLSGELLESSDQFGQFSVTVAPLAIERVLAGLRDRLRFDFLVDLTAVDYTKREPRFDLIYILYSFQVNERVRVKTRLGAEESAVSVTGIYPSANWMEREVFDLFGIPFTGHPDLKRILLPENWTGHPLRKDYSIIQQDAGWVRENLGIESGQ